MGFGSAAIFARIGMNKFNPLPATFISSVASLVPLMLLALIFAIDDFKALPPLAYLLFLGHEVLAKQVKDRRESITMFEKGGRADLVDKESAELSVLEEYLPPQMSPQDLSEIIRCVIEEVGAKTLQDKGKVMGKLMPQVRGLADGSEVNALVENILGSA